MFLKHFSIACCAAVLSIGAFPLPSQASTTREKFFSGVIYVLNKEPRSEGDEKALRFLAAANKDADREFIYDMGKSYCAAIGTKLMSSDEYSAIIKKAIIATQSTDEVKQTLWALQLAATTSAKYTICPD